MEAWLVPGSLGLVALTLLIASLGLPIPEDPVLLAAGVLAHRTGVSLALVTGICGTCALVGDFGLFAFARHYGTRALDRPILRRLLPPARRQSLERLLDKHGNMIVLVARHLPGLRAPIFALAGLHRMRSSRFLLWDALGLAIFVPVIVSLGWLGASHVDLVRKQLARAEHWVAATAGVLALLAWALLAFRHRRRLDRGQVGSADEPLEDDLSARQERR